MNKEIPEILLEAAKLFVEELDSHSAIFDKLLREIETQKNLSDQKTMVSYRERFHTIKGGAGFLGLHELATRAGRGEELLKSSCLGPEHFQELEEIIACVRRERTRLRSELLTGP